MKISLKSLLSTKISHKSKLNTFTFFVILDAKKSTNYRSFFTNKNPANSEFFKLPLFIASSATEAKNTYILRSCNILFAFLFFIRI